MTSAGDAIDSPAFPAGATPRGRSNHWPEEAPHTLAAIFAKVSRIGFFGSGGVLNG